MVHSASDVAAGTTSDPATTEEATRVLRSASSRRGSNSAGQSGTAPTVQRALYALSGGFDEATASCPATGASRVEGIIVAERVGLAPRIGGDVVNPANSRRGTARAAPIEWGATLSAASNAAANHRATKSNPSGDQLRPSCAPLVNGSC
jgi:hypothetical protein